MAIQKVKLYGSDALLFSDDYQMPDGNDKFILEIYIVWRILQILVYYVNADSLDDDIVK